MGVPEGGEDKGRYVGMKKYDGHEGKVAVTFHPDGIREFADEFGEDAA